MRQTNAAVLETAEIYRGTSPMVYVNDSIHDGRPMGLYCVGVPDIPDGPGKALATLIRAARARQGVTQEQLADAVGVTRQTIIQYESGKAVSPDPGVLIAVLIALDIDLREAAVAFGRSTREEMDLPPQLPAVHPKLLDIQHFLDDGRIPKRQRDNLLRGVTSALDVWVDMARVKPHREPAANSRRDRASR